MNLLTEMKFSTRRHFILLAIAISFDLNKIASGLQLPWDPSGGWINYGLGWAEHGLNWMKWGLDRLGRWRGGQIHNLGLPNKNRVKNHVFLL